MVRDAESVLVRLLEKFCWRAALLAGTIESHASAGVGLGFDDRVTYDSGKDERGGGNRQMAIPDRGDHCGMSGASLRNG
jgi:hypothetical protein